MAYILPRCAKDVERHASKAHLHIASLCVEPRELTHDAIQSTADALACTKVLMLQQPSMASLQPGFRPV